jgi:adenylate kinase
MSEKPSRFGLFRAFVLLGAPGSGKGTQGKILGTIPRFVHFSVGEAFRSLDTRTDIGKQFVDFSSRGQLVPDELTMLFCKTQLKSQIDAHTFKPEIDFLILDGMPRSVTQAELIQKYVDVLQVFHLSCPKREELARRLRKRALKESRFDDASDDVIARRIKTYEEETKPILEFYGDSMVTNIDATQPPAKVLFDILNKMQQLPSWQTYSEVKA